MRMRLYAIAAVLLVTGGLAASSARASGVCHRLWAERNAIYKDNGYCFHTWRARGYFGNYGCAFPDEYEVPLSYGAEARIADIVEREYAYGCRGYYDRGYGHHVSHGYGWD